MRLFGKDVEPQGDWFTTGAPAAGTEAAVSAIEQGGDGPGAITVVDPTFRADAFVAWSGTVYARATAAWRTRSPEPLKPVMAAPVWHDYASHLLGMSSLRLLQVVMSAGRGTPALLGTSAGAGAQSALVLFDVATDPGAFAELGLPNEHRTWQERWLFQRPADCRTHGSGAVAACPVCGAPAEPEDTGRCRYCKADITTRTAGWLVTRTQTTLDAIAKWDARRSVRPPSVVEAPGAAAPLQPPRAQLQPPRAPLQPPRAAPPA